MKLNEVNYRENMQDVFHQLADMNLNKKNRRHLAGLLRAAYLNGMAANHAGDSDHYEDVYWLAEDSSK
jgi:hypothetical protein